MLAPPDLRALFDANVVASGLYNPQGTPGRLLMLALQGRYRLVLSRQVLEETGRTIERKMPRALAAWQAFIEENRFEVVAVPPREAIARWASVMPVADAAILASAISAGVSHLVTGNLRDFERPETRALLIPRLVSPRTFLDVVESQKEGP